MVLEPEWPQKVAEMFLPAEETRAELKSLDSHAEK